VLAAKNYFIFNLSVGSLHPLQWLLDQTSNADTNSTLTIWGSDDISQDEILQLKIFIGILGQDRIYLDVSYDMENPQKKVDNTKTHFWTLIIAADVFNLFH
jgi:hypothetical protein